MIENISLTLDITNNVNYPVSANVLGSNVDLLDNSNSNTEYRWDVTGFIFAGENQLALQYKLNSDASFSTYVNFIEGSNFDAVITTLNALGIGFFSYYTESGQDYIGTYNNNYAFGDLNIYVLSAVNQIYNYGSGFDSYSNVTYPLNNGDLMVGGDFTTYKGSSVDKIAYVFNDGTYNNTFTEGVGFNAQVRTINQQSDSKYLVGGDFTDFDGTTTNYLARLNPSPQVATQESLVNTNMYLGGGFDNYVFSSAIQSDGKIIVGGSFTTYSGFDANNVVRLNTNGSVDTTFNNNGVGFNSSIQVLNLQSDGKILFGGFFTSYNGTGANRIIRLNIDGSIDNTFSYGSGFNNVPYTITIQSNGKIIIGGIFTFYNFTSANNIIRLNSDGSIDPTFIYGSGFNGIVLSTAQQSDGKILCGGTFTSYKGTSSNRIIRLNDDGSIDNTFSIGSGFNNTVYAIAIQSDGKILCGGTFTSYNGTPANNIIRLNSDGSIDTSFVYGSGFGSSFLDKITIQSDGKILCGGVFSSYDGTSVNNIVRLNTDGSIDTTFDIGSGFDADVKTISVNSSNGLIYIGGAFTSFNSVQYNYFVSLFNTPQQVPIQTLYNADFVYGNGFNALTNAISKQNDGKLICGGQFTSYNGTTSNRVVRINTDGSLDNTFNIGTGITGGIFPEVFAIAIQPNGSVLIGGTFTTFNGNSANRIVRLTSSGSYDSTFSVGSGFDSTVLKVVLQNDGKILCGGTFGSYNGTTAPNFVRLNIDGSIDNTFVYGTGFDSVVRSIALQSDGKILCGGGFSLYNGISINGIIRLNSDGSVDNTFNSGTGFTNGVISIAIQIDGKILCGGGFIDYNGTSVNRIIRLQPDGTIDTSFQVGTGFDNNVQIISCQSDGKIYIGGDFNTYNGTPAGYIVRLNSDGSIDNTWYFGFPFNNIVYDILVNEINNTTYIAGEFTTYLTTNANRIVSLYTTAQSQLTLLDTSFNINLGTTLNSNVYTTAFQQNQQILVGGDFQGTYNSLIRLNTNGTTDTNFQVTDFDALVTSIVVQPNQYILVGGNFTNYQSTTNNKIVRLLPNGSLDTSFVSGSGFDSQVNIIALLSNGQMYVGGSFTSYNGTTCNRIVRLNANGTIDNSFDIGTGFDNDVSAIQVLYDNSIVVGGAFTNYNGSTHNYIIRLYSNGTIFTTWGTGTGFDGQVFNISPTNINGCIYISGAFSTFDGNSANNTIALNV